MSENHQSVLLLEKLRNKVTVEQYTAISSLLINFSEEQKSNLLIALSTTELKSIKKTLLLSIFLGFWGVDRFYLGQMLIGVLKLFFYSLFGIYLVLFLFAGMWWFIDLFLSYRIARVMNYEKIITLIILIQNQKKNTINTE